MRKSVHMDSLEPPWVADEAWQQTSDTVFKALAIHGYLTLQLQAGSRHHGALQAASACVRDMLDHQALSIEGLCAAGEAADVGLQDLGYKQVLDYRSGPWPAGTLGAQQHSILQKAMAAGQDVCKAVLRCVAASKGARLPPNSLNGLVESLPLDPQHWSASSLHAVRNTPRAMAAAELGHIVYTPANINRGLVTLLYAPGQAGLQVRDAYGEWREVGLLGEDQVLLMPGHTLEYALCGLLPSAKHRLLAPAAGESARFNLTFELLPAGSAHIDFRAPLDAAGHIVLGRRYPPRTGEDLMSWLRCTYPRHNHRTGGAGVESVFASAASRSADSPGTAGDACVPGKRHASTSPQRGQEAAWADEMLDLYIKTVTGKSVSLTVSRFATLASILLDHQDKIGVPPDQVRLHFAGRSLGLHRTPADYGLEYQDTVQAVLRLNGD